MSDQFLSDLWKSVHKKDWQNKDQILEAIESCFVEIDRRYDEIASWYREKKKTIYMTNKVRT